MTGVYGEYLGSSRIVKELSSEFRVPRPSVVGTIGVILAQHVSYSDEIHGEHLLEFPNGRAVALTIDGPHEKERFNLLEIYRPAWEARGFTPDIALVLHSAKVRPAFLYCGSDISLLTAAIATVGMGDSYGTMLPGHYTDPSGHRYILSHIPYVYAKDRMLKSRFAPDGYAHSRLENWTKGE